MPLFEDILWSSLRMATPLCFAAMGGLLAERAGVINIALEGFMLLGAFTAATFTFFSHSPWLGMAGAGFAGGIFALLFAFFALNLRGNQVVIGMGLNGLAMGLTPYLNKLAFGVTSSTPSLPIEDRFSYAPTILVMGLVIGLQLGLRHLRGGLWLRTAGENAEALEAAGRSIRWTRWTALILSGITAALGGAVLSTMLASQFSRQMTAGTGFMAIAALILGRWRPLPSAAVCLLFGLTEAMQIRMQTSLSSNEGVWFLPLIPLFPYMITLLVLASRWGTAKAPNELGQISH